MWNLEHIVKSPLHTTINAEKRNRKYSQKNVEGFLNMPLSVLARTFILVAHTDTAESQNELISEAESRCHLTITGVEKSGISGALN